VAVSDDDPLFGDGGDPLSRELGTRRRRGVTKPESPAESASRGPFDAMPLEDQGGPDLLELESVPPPPARSGPRPPVAPAPAAPAPSEPRVFAPPPRDETSETATLSRAPARRVEERLPTLEVMSVADYGPTPGLLGAIPYAIHVRSRQRELVHHAEEARDHRKAAEVGVEQALAQVGKAVLDQGDAVVDDSLRDAFEAARQATSAAGATTARVGQEAVEHRERLAALEGELETARREVDPHRDRENKLRTQLDVREKELGRAQATLRRAQIELRNFAAHAQPGEAPERIAMLRADVEARSHEVASAEIPVKELTDKLTEQKRELALRLGRVAQLEHDIAQHKRAKDRNTLAFAATETEAARASRRALEALGKKARETGAIARVDRTLMENLERAEQKLAERARREKLYRAAIEAYDKPTYYRGVGTLAAAAIVIVAMILFALARAIF
jgi:hypothetical protein